MNESDPDKRDLDHMMRWRYGWEGENEKGRKGEREREKGMFQHLNINTDNNMNNGFANSEIRRVQKKVRHLDRGRHILIGMVWVNWQSSESTIARTIECFRVSEIF